MALAQRKKQDDKILKLLREVANLPGNKHCFDCGEKGTTYVNSTIGSFVCTTCSGILRGLTPPHRVKSISMATFTQEEIDFLKAHGNAECAKTWLGLWEAKRAIKQDHRDFMIDKYERKRYYLEPASPLMSIPSGRQLANNSQNSTVNNNCNKNLNASQHKADVDNLAVLKSINLTPPSSSHRINKPPQSLQNQQNSNGSPLFKTVGPRALNGHRVNGSGGSGTNSNSSTGSDANNKSANKFTPDTDFVADFSKIDLFSSETTTSTNNNVNNNNNHNNGSSLVNNHNNNNNRNGFVMLNGGDNKLDGATKISSNNNKNGVFENFADFEHNQIYNAAEDPLQIFSNVNFFGNMPLSQTSVHSTQQNDYGAKLMSNSPSAIISSNQQLQNNNNNNSIFDFDFINKSLNNNVSLHQQQQQQHQWNYWQAFPYKDNYNNSKNCNVSNLNNNIQQYQETPQMSPFSSSLNFNNNNTTQNQSVFSPPPLPTQSESSNRWSLPMSVGSGSSLSSSTTFNSSSSINSTPSADKYAALKDLDEQFKEIKILEGADSTPTGTNNQNNFANPFKNPTLLQSTLNSNAINANNNSNAWNNSFQVQPEISNNKNGILPSTNGFATQFTNYSQTNGNGFMPNQSQLFNGNSGWPVTGQNMMMNGKMGGFNVTSNGNYGFGQNNCFSNPFTAQAGTVNSNNPFL
uniref:CSON011186 protein n=1 Tax=Culicoides sonorensis TaxID=179676 RepID=A0A336LQK8_CULSO